MLKAKCLIENLTFLISVLSISLAVAPGFLAAQELAAEAVEADQDPEESDENMEEVEEENEEAAAAMQVVGNQFGVDPRKMIAAKKFLLTQTFVAEIELLERICDLEESQILKLTIGSKGAVKKLTAEWQKTSGAQFGVALDVKDDKPAGKELTIKDADEIDETTLQFVAMDMGNPFRFDPPTEHEFWKKTLASVLTDPQKKTLDEYQKKKEDVKRNSMIQSTIDSMSQELALTEEQHEKLAELMKEKMQDCELRTTMLYQNYVLYYYASKVSQTSLREFLSPAQLQKWKIAVAPAKQVGQMIEMNNNQVVRGVAIEVDLPGPTTTEFVGEVLDGIERFADNYLKFFRSGKSD